MAHVHPPHYAHFGPPRVAHFDPPKVVYYARFLQYLIRNAIEKLDYDYIFIDCPPNVGISTSNALIAADYCIVPVSAEPFALDGFEIMLDLIRKIRENPNPNLVLLGLVITLYDERLIISRMIRQDIEEKGWGVALFDTMIRDNTAVPNSQHKTQRKTIFEFDRKSHAAQDYVSLGNEIVKKIKELKSKK